MADEITIVLKADTASFRREVKSALDAGGAQARQFKSALDSSVGSVNALRSSLGGLKTAFAALGGAFVLKQIADAAIQSAINIDKTRQTMVALTGSVEAANKKIAELRELAKSSPGVTSSLATDLFAQFKALRTVADSTINEVIKSIGRLNTVFAIPDVKTFGRNLVQIFTGGFEKDQIKEALQSVPIFEQLLEEAFGTKDGEKLRKLKDAGKLTMETFLLGLKEKINERFGDVRDSIGSLFEKLKDRVTVALEPLGVELTKILLPVFDDAAKKVEEYGSVAARVFAKNRDDIIATAKEITRMAVEIGKLIGKIADLGASSGIFRFIAVGAAALRDIADDPFQLNPFSKGPNVRAVEAQFDKMEREALETRLRAGGRGLSAADAKFLAEQSAPGFLKFDPATGQIVRGTSASPSRAALFGTGTGTGTGTTTTTTTGSTGGRARKPEDLLSGLNVRRREEQTFAEKQKELERLQEENVKLLVDEFRDRNERLREGRVARARLTQEFGQQEIETLLRGARRDLTRSGRFIDAAASRGQLTAGEAETLGQSANAAFANKLRDALALEEKMVEVNQANIDNLKEEIALYDQLSVGISDTERFMRGFNSQIETSGDAFDRFGQNVARAFGNVRDLFNGLKQAVLGFFNDLVGNSLQNLVRGVLGPLFGGGGGGSAGGGIGNFFRSLGGGGGGGISAPASVSSATGIFANGAFARGLAGSSGTDEFFGAGVPRTAGSVGGSFLGGIGKSFAAAAPLLGLGLGGSLGGSSIPGQIAGSAGGLLGGGAIAGFSGALGAKAAAFFTNPFTIAIGAGLLIGSFFLGRSKQRKQDEELSGQFLTQALQGIDQLAAGVASGQVTTLAEARSIFDSQILGTFRQQIGSLKTKSVRESRLTNQVRDLQNVFNARIPPLIFEQERRAADLARFAAIDRRLIPEFASGGLVPGIDRGRDSVLSLLRPGELVLTRGQQASVMMQSNPGVFDQAGVPRTAQTGPVQAFQGGGFAGPGGRSSITLYVQVGMSQSGAEEITAAAFDSNTGQRLIVDAVQRARLDKELN